MKLKIFKKLFFTTSKQKESIVQILALPIKFICGGFIITAFLLILSSIISKRQIEKEGLESRPWMERDRQRPGLQEYEIGFKKV